LGIRDKLLDFKRRLQDRKMYSIVIVLIGAISLWGIYQYKRAANLRQELDNQYNRAFYEMVGYVNNVETLLAKSMICNTTEKTAIMLQEAWKQATLAQTNLGQLPVTQPVLASTSKFLTQVGDLSLTLDNQNIKGKSLDEKQQETLERMYKYAVKLNKSLKELQKDLSEGRLKWGELANKGTTLFKKTSPGEVMKKIESIDTTFQDYPTLIYDGPFSDHMTSGKAKGLTGDFVKPEEAAEKVRKFLGEDRIQDVEQVGKSDSDPIKTYSFNVTLKNAGEDEYINIGISQKGGHVVWMLYHRPVGDIKVDMQTVRKAGAEFLREKGYENMEETYYLTHGNVATINYAYRQDGVTVYPDLIKLKIAMDTGEVIGMEANSYLCNHVKRDIPEPKISAEEARAKINKRLQIRSTGMAIIPTNYKSEKFCYEFKGKLEKNDFIVYINAITGEEEEILMIVDTPNGVLTI